MHDDFYKMIGCLYAESRLASSRDAALTAAANTGVGATAAGKLAGIANELLDAAFDFEIKENAFQKAWEASQPTAENAILAVAVAAGRYNRLPAGTQLRADYKKLLRDPGSGEAAHQFIDGIRRQLTSTERAAARDSAATSTLTNAARNLRTILDGMETPLGDFDDAVETLFRAFTDEAQEFESLYPSLSSVVSPWSIQDERLRKLLDFMRDSAKASLGGGTGNNSTPSWGSTGTSGSSSSGGTP